MEITTAVIALARRLNLTVLAEGVETPAQQRLTATSFSLRTDAGLGG